MFSAHHVATHRPVATSQQMASATLAWHQHGKSKVRLGRTWRQGNVHHFVEFAVHTMLESDMEHAFIKGDNKDMTATDTQRNTVRGPPLWGVGAGEGRLVLALGPQLERIE